MDAAVAGMPAEALGTERPEDDFKEARASVEKQGSCPGAGHSPGHSSCWTLDTHLPPGMPEFRTGTDCVPECP